jgi:hypothetical protein
MLAAVPLHAEDHGGVGGVIDQLLSPLRRGTTVELKSLPTFLQRAFLPTLPEKENTFKILGQPIDAVLETPAGFRAERRNGGIVITAPRGEAQGYVRVRTGNRELSITVVNLVPYESMHKGWLDGYRIGEYMLAPLRGLAAYARPNGFMKLTPANRDLFVSDHYRMRDFQCKLDGSSKFLILRSEALVKLELMQHTLQTTYRLAFDRFTIMSGYRTPYYNAKIGNETSYSRHLYGDAMDVYIDQNRDGVMDDVNRDGRVDANDAKFLLSVAEKLDSSAQWGWLKGGAGVYHATAAHGPYLHVDARGYVARWGV